MSNWIFLNFEFFLLYLDSLKRIFKEQVTFSKFWVSWVLSFFSFTSSLSDLFSKLWCYISSFLIKLFHKTGLIFYSSIFIIFNEQHIFSEFWVFFLLSYSNRRYPAPFYRWQSKNKQTSYSFSVNFFPFLPNNLFLSLGVLAVPWLVCWPCHAMFLSVGFGDFCSAEVTAGRCCWNFSPPTWGSGVPCLIMLVLSY